MSPAVGGRARGGLSPAATSAGLQEDARYAAAEAVQQTALQVQKAVHSNLLLVYLMFILQYSQWRHSVSEGLQLPLQLPLIL